MNACEKKSKSLLEKPDIRPDIRYPVTSGYPNPDFQDPDIRVSGFKISIRYNPSENNNKKGKVSQPVSLLSTPLRC